MPSYTCARHWDTKTVQKLEAFSQGVYVTIHRKRDVSEPRKEDKRRMPRIHRRETRDEKRQREEVEITEVEAMLEDHFATNKSGYNLPSKLGGADKDGRNLHRTTSGRDTSNDSMRIRSSAEERGASPTPSVARSGNRALQTPLSLAAPPPMPSLHSANGVQIYRRPPGREMATPPIEHTCKRKPGLLEICTDELTFIYDLIHFLKERGEQEKARCVQDDLILMNGVPMDWHCMYVEVIARRGGIARGHWEAISQPDSLFDHVDFHFAEEVFPRMRNSHGGPHDGSMTPEDIHRILMNHYLDYLLDYERAHPQDASKAPYFHCGKYGVSDWVMCAQCKEWMHLKCDSLARRQQKAHNMCNTPFACARCSPEGKVKGKEIQIDYIDLASDSEEENALSDAARPTDASVGSGAEAGQGALRAAVKAAVGRECAAETNTGPGVSQSDCHEESGDEDRTVAAAMEDVDAMLRDAETIVLCKNGDPNSAIRGQEIGGANEAQSVEGEQAVAATASDDGVRSSSPAEAPAPDHGAESTEKSWSGTTMQVISDSAERISDQPSAIKLHSTGLKEKPHCQASADYRPQRKKNRKLGLPSQSVVQQLDTRLCQSNTAQAGTTSASSNIATDQTRMDPTLASTSESRKRRLQQIYWDYRGLFE
ncbi:hypothetical protein CYMTET_52008 [Cymbomonas tetramitiformis]|uniref:ARID domain-containing protein n=1 Tax=Cymbomonas tetramitiformis TaxID=36881 RepID=A0AAE0BL15_9CHLO|nr:hypothetical protein CYMTET_52008 [Cymbomonas tetramitiformis]